MSSPLPASRGVLVTGSSRGVGAAVARAFAERGDRVVVHHRSSDSRERAEAVRAGLPGEGHGVLAADLADPDAVRRLADDAAAALGRVDVLVYNAAMNVAPRGGWSTSARGVPTAASPTSPPTGPARPRCTRSASRWPSGWRRTASP